MMKIRLFPKIRFINYHKSCPASKGIWKQWFQVKRFWGGKIIEINIRHLGISIDFRKNWIEDMFKREKEGGK